jgi:beta-aspartyl-dipeptidase (metallo-type)
MLTLIEGGRVYAPEPCGVRQVLLADGHIGKVGEIDRGALERLGAEYEVIDARGCIVAPALIDPHVHLLGGSGETGFSTQTPEFFISELVRNGVTTVVGTLGVDTTMKTMAGLLAKVKALKEHGLNAFCWTGGYDLPPASILGSVREDILFIDEVIGAGEIAISDTRALPHDPRELARVAVHAHVGGMLAQKAGLVHVHVGEADSRLDPVVRVLDEFDVEADWFYPTHVERSEKLMGQAISLARKGGMPVDVDVVERDLHRWVAYWRDHGGPPHLLTASSDASINRPALMQQLRDCVLNHGFALEQVLPIATRNTARILKLREKGELRKGCAGDILLLEEGSLEIVHVLSHGTFVVRDGRVVEQEAWLEESDRRIRLEGKKAGDGGTDED